METLGVYLSLKPTEAEFVEFILARGGQVTAASEQRAVIVQGGAKVAIELNPPPPRRGSLVFKEAAALGVDLAAFLGIYLYGDDAETAQRIALDVARAAARRWGGSWFKESVEHWLVR
jgi:hypothetical protein